MTPEVATYIQSFKNFLKNNDEARLYFLSGTDEDIFFEQFSELAEKNLVERGEPMLNRNQLEELRKTSALPNIEKTEPQTKLTISKDGFVDIPNIGLICLN